MGIDFQPESKIDFQPENGSGQASSPPSQSPQSWLDKSLPELISPGIGQRTADRIKAFVEHPVTSEAVSIFRDSAPGVILRAFDLINQGVNAVATGPLGSAVGSVATAAAPYTLPRLLGLEKGTPQGDIQFGQDIGQGVTNAADLAWPFFTGQIGQGIKAGMGYAGKGIGAAIGGAGRMMGVPEAAPALTREQMILANADKHIKFAQEVARRENTFEDLAAKIAAAKQSQAATTETLQAEKATAIKGRQTEIQGLKNKILDTQAAKPGEEVAAKLATGIAPEVVTQRAAGLEYRGPDFQSTSAEPQGLYWDKQRAARAPFTKEYKDIREAGKIKLAPPTETRTQIDAFREEAGLGGKAFPTAGERAAGSLERAVTINPEDLNYGTKSPLDVPSGPRPRDIQLAQGTYGNIPVGYHDRVPSPGEQLLLDKTYRLDPVTLDDQGVEIARQTIAKNQSGAPLSQHMTVEMYDKLLAGVVDNPNVNFADLEVAQKRIRGAARTIKDENVKRQLGLLDKALDADMAAANEGLWQQKATLDAAYKEKIVPYYVSGAIPRTLAEKSPASFVSSLVRPDVGKADPGAILDGMQRVKEVIGPEHMKRLVARPWLDILQYRASKSKDFADSFYTQYFSHSDEARSILLADAKPAADRVVQTMRDMPNRAKELQTQLQRLQVTPNTAAETAQAAIEGQKITDYDQIAKNIKTGMEATHPVEPLYTKIPKEAKTLGERIGGVLEKKTTWAGGGLVVYGAVQGSLVKIVSGLVVLSVPVFSELLATEKGASILYAMLVAEKGSSLLTKYAIRANAILNPLQSRDATLEEKIAAAKELLP